MKFILAALSVPALVAAQAYGPAPGSSPAASSGASSVASSTAPVATPSAAPGQHFITLAPTITTLIFQPNNITAAENDTVTFLFPTSGGFQHSVTQASFAKPCVYEAGGFDSGLQNNGFEFTIKITNASQPIWFFCTQTTPVKHCGSGMVGGINVPSTGSNNIQAFVSAAEALGANEQVQTATGGLSGIGAAATASAASTSIAAASSGSSTPSGAERLVAGTGSLLAALFAAFTLA